MSQQPQRDPRRAPRSARHRGSVLGPPPGIESGTGYSGSQSSPRGGYQYPRPPPRVPTPPTPTSAPFVPITGPSLAPPRARNVRPDPDIFDPIMEEPSPRRLRRNQQRDTTASASTPTAIFYPSTTTVSSVDSDPVEPMPFFRTDPRLRASGSPRTSLPSTREESAEVRTVSVASSGVLGVGTLEVDPDSSSEDEGSVSTDSSFGQLMREVSTVRRGQARIVRNPSATRRSVVPEVLYHYEGADIRFAQQTLHQMYLHLHRSHWRHCLHRCRPEQQRPLQIRHQCHLHKFRHAHLGDSHDSARLRLHLYDCDDYRPFHSNQDQSLASIAIQAARASRPLGPHLKIPVFSVYHLLSPYMEGEVRLHHLLAPSVPMDPRRVDHLEKSDLVLHRLIWRLLQKFRVEEV